MLRLCFVGRSQVGELLAELNTGPLSSFLMETTAALHHKVDDAQPGKSSGSALVDAVLDSCGSKGGHGPWECAWTWVWTWTCG